MSLLYIELGSTYLRIFYYQFVVIYVAIQCNMREAICTLIALSFNNNTRNIKCKLYPFNNLKKG